MRVSVGLVVFFTLCRLSSSFDLPDLRDFFNNLVHSKTDDVTSKSDDEVHSRNKRQNPDIGDESQLHYEVKCSALPTLTDRVTPNSRYLPTLGNGHISTTVYNDSMYMNGLYNGDGGSSHRAKIPAILMSRISLGREDLEERATRKYTFNAHEGYFLETIDCELAYIEHRMYVHQKYIRVFVSDIYARKKLHGGTLYLDYPELSESADITFGQPSSYYGQWQVSGQTNTPEEGTNTQPINIFYMNPATEIPITGSAIDFNTTLVMAVDRQESPARSEFDTALNILNVEGGHYRLFSEHVAAWQRVWAQGRVEVEGDKQIAKLTTFSQYYILSSMPAPFPNQAPQHSEIFYGVGRNSLAKGGFGRDSQGHVMWDNEMHILPTFLLFHPNTVKKALRYRSTMAPRALSNAEKYGGKGYHFPWESGFYGEEVSPEADECPECSWHKYHTTGAVGWLIRMYYSATRDRDYRQNVDYNGCDMTREIARFFADRAIYKPEHGRYDIDDCTGPDENHPRVNNNAYTLVLASLAIHYARYFACLCQRTERDEVPDEWIHKALYLNLPFDNVKRLHAQHDDFDPESLVRQADTIMLTYPLNWNMSADIMKNDLLFYEQITDTKTPGLTWSFFTVGFKWVGEDVRMQNYFLKSYQEYLIQPFKIWTEFNEQNMNDQDAGSVNFLPGMGGFLQSLVFGFAGVRIRPEMLEFHRPIPPPGCTKLSLIHMNYLQSNMTIVIEANSKVTIQVHEIGEYPLILRRNNTAMIEESLPPGSYVEIDNAAGGFFIYTSILEACEHPRDFIYMPWGYSPFVDGAGQLRQLTVLTLLTLLLSCLYNMRHSLF